MKYKKNNNIKNQKNFWKGITLTDKAAKKINNLLSKNNKIIGVKIQVKKSGCAGFSYSMTCITVHDMQYINFFNKNINLYVSNNDLFYIDGTEIDYIQEGLNGVFKFNNPKSKNLCGCGESFAIE